MPPDPRPGLGARKPRRPHPASPEAVSSEEHRSESGASANVARETESELVMLCVRVAPALRRRLKLAAVQSGRPLQALVTEALERMCTREGM